MPCYKNANYLLWQPLIRKKPKDKEEKVSMYTLFTFLSSYSFYKSIDCVASLQTISNTSTPQLVCHQDQLSLHFLTTASLFRLFSQEFLLRPEYILHLFQSSLLFFVQEFTKVFSPSFENIFLLCWHSLSPKLVAHFFQLDPFT